MWFRKNKIKETPKRGMYGNSRNTSNYSVWDHMSSIEKLCMIGLPIGLPIGFPISISMGCP